MAATSFFFRVHGVVLSVSVWEPPDTSSREHGLFELFLGSY